MITKSKLLLNRVSMPMNGNKHFFQQTVLGKGDPQDTKLHYTEVKDVTLRAKTTKENTEVNLTESGFDNDFYVQHEKHP